MPEPDPSCVVPGLPPIFEKKAREHAMAKAVMDATRDFDEEQADVRRVERAEAAVARHAGRRNPASKKARAKARRQQRMTQA